MTASAGTMFGINPLFGAPQQPVGNVLTILHTNDTHARLDPFPDDDARYAGLGGIARRAALVKRIRAENPNTLLLDAGDTFQGTPYFNFYKCRLDFQLMSRMGYDVSAIGNHEFDNGVSGFAASASHANFDFVCANYFLANTPLKDLVKTQVVKKVGGMKVGIFGLGVRLNGYVADDNFKGIFFRNAEDMAKSMVASLRHYHGCDLVICLSHLGYRYNDANRESDIRIAEAVPGIDIIIGGHTHTFLDQPHVITHPDGSKCHITQVGFAGIILGRIDVEFGKSGDVKGIAAANSSIDSRLDKA